MAFVERRAGDRHNDPEQVFATGIATLKERIGSPRPPGGLGNRGLGDARCCPVCSRMPASSIAPTMPFDADHGIDFRRSFLECWSV
jgi:hypothetical protein